LKNIWTRWRHINDLRAILGVSKSQKVIEAYDQDHGMVLGLGIRYGLFQAIMLKPPNVQYIARLVSSKPTVIDFA
jgi:hypothetical protein